METAMRANLLTVKTVDKLVRHGEPGLTNDGAGLYLKVGRSGAASWIYRFKLDGKSRDMGLGALSHCALPDARRLASDARALVKSGIDPINARNESNIGVASEPAVAVTFQQAAEEYVEAHKAGWKSAKHAQQWTNTLTTYAYPKMAEKAVCDIDTDDVLDVLRPIWLSKAETASRVRNRIELVLDAAKARNLRQGENPARWRGHLDKLLAKRKVTDKCNHAALPWTEIPRFYAALCECNDLSSLAIRLTVLCAVRTNETLGARWSEFDLDEALWSIPAARMKRSKVHRVPLSEEAVRVLKQLQAQQKNAYVFPGMKDNKPLSNLAMLMKLRRMDASSINTGGCGWRNTAGQVITMHGFRSSFRDWAAEATSFQNIVPEMALAHSIGNAAEAAYRRGDLLEKRRELMSLWAAYCCSGQSAG